MRKLTRKSKKNYWMMMVFVNLFDISFFTKSTNAVQLLFDSFFKLGISLSITSKVPWTVHGSLFKHMLINILLLVLKPIWAHFLVDILVDLIQDSLLSEWNTTIMLLVMFDGMVQHSDQSSHPTQNIWLSWENRFPISNQLSTFFTRGMFQILESVLNFDFQASHTSFSSRS